MGAMKSVAWLGLAALALGLQIPAAWAEKPQSKSSATREKSRPQAAEIELDLGTPAGKENRKSAATSAAPADTGKFAELNFEKSFVIEAKVERPQVQFPLLKEPPPEKNIPFEASFRDELLKSPRENTFLLK